MVGLLRFGRKRGILTLYILYTLNKKPKSGYEIIKEITEKTHGCWIISKGSLYPTLKQLEKEGLIKLIKSGKRSKKIFALTKLGKRLLQEIKRYKKEIRKNFYVLKELFIDILEITDIEALLAEIDTLAHMKQKRKVKSVLKNCLRELKRI